MEKHIHKTNIKGGSISWFRTGGIIKNFFNVTDINQLYDALVFLHNCIDRPKYHIIGATTNTLLYDGDFDGIIKISLNKIQIIDTSTLYVQAGVMTSQLIRFCIANNIGGLEFMQTIPGTIGGLIKMNAGAFGYEIKDVVNEVELMNVNNINANNIQSNILSDCIKTIDASKIDFQYRKTDITDIILGAKFKCYPQDSQVSQEKLTFLQQSRKATQPLNIRTLGSVFKNPLPYKAGKIIEDCNLKGVSVGGARISNKHANFIENFNNATAQDYMDLVHIAQDTILEKMQINLEPEFLYFTNDNQY